jgi:Type VI secretion system, TssN
MNQNAPIEFSWDHFTQVLAQNREIAGLYSAVFIFITLLIGYIPVAAHYFHLAPGPVVILQLGAHLATGFWNISILKKKLSFLDPLLQDSFLYTVLLSVTAGLALLLTYTIAGFSQLSLAAAGSGCFLLPFVIRQTRNLYASIPAAEYKIWYNPATTPTAGTMVPIRTPIRFKIAANYFDIDEQVFPVAVPEKVKLGKVFHQFVTEHNAKATSTTIECTDASYQPYGWQFHTMKWGGLVKQVLDPDLNLAQNKIKNDTVIIVTRIKTPQIN